MTTENTAPAPLVTGLSHRLDFTLRRGFTAKPEGEHHGESPLGRSQILSEVLVAGLRDFAAEAKRITASNAYSESGRAERLRELGKKHLAKINEIAKNDRFRAAIERRRGNAEAMIAQTLKAMYRDVDFARESEARQMLYDLPSDSERFEAWKRIVESRDPVGLAAVLNAPSIVRRLLPESAVKAGTDSILEATVPESLKTKTECDQALWSVDTIVNDARQMIAEVAGIESTLRERLDAQAPAPTGAPARSPAAEQEERIAQILGQAPNGAPQA
jgi:hypothetical protein